MVWLLASGRITVGGFSVLLASFAALTGSFTQLFGHAAELLKTSTMAAPFFALMDLEAGGGTEELAGGTGPDGEAARLEHVSYRYLNEEGYALKDISLSVQKGERIAIVGENGAGKTTLAKLLSGFLLPTEGVMELGGVERGRLGEDSIFGQVSAWPWPGAITSSDPSCSWTSLPPPSTRWRRWRSMRGWRTWPGGGLWSW